MNLLRTASTVSLLTLASRITGLVRDQLIAASFGVSSLTDAYNVSFRIPNLLRRLFAEGAFSQAFVPILAQTRARDGDQATRQLIDAVATMLCWSLLFTVALGVLAAPLVVWVMASGLARFDEAVFMTRVMFPYIGFISLVALACGVLNTWGRYALPAATPVLLNLSMIAAALWVAPWFKRRGWEPIYALTLGVLGGGLLQLAVQSIALRRMRLLPRVGLSGRAFRNALAHPGVGRTMTQMGTALIGVSVATISMMINTQIASHVGVGAVSWLSNADRLMEFPTGLLGVALGVVLLPQLSAARAVDDVVAYSNLLDLGLRLVVLLTVPCAVALLIFSQALLAVVFHYGAYTAADVAQTLPALRGYGVGLLGLVAVKVLAPGFYAQQDVRTPVKIAIGVLLFTQLMNALLVPRLGYAGLALATSIGALFNALFLYIGLRRNRTYMPAPGWVRFVLQVVLASTVLGAALAAAAHAIDWIALGHGHRLQRAGLMLACLAAAACLYFSSLFVTGVRLKDFMRRA